MSNQKLVYQGSTFLPSFDHSASVSLAKKDVLAKIDHAAAIAMATVHLMEAHTLTLRLDRNNLEKLDISETDLQNLSLGYQYPLQSILASSVCKPLPKNERPDTFEKLLNSTRHLNALRIQDQMLQDLRATINLLKMDPSGALVFEFLKKYPFSQDKYFLAGMEIAAIVFFGISLELAKALGDDSWLNVTYDPNQT